jgi:hypothetical protein
MESAAWSIRDADKRRWYGIFLDEEDGDDLLLLFADGFAGSESEGFSLDETTHRA